MVIFHRDFDGFIPAPDFAEHERAKRLANSRSHSLPRAGGSWRLLRTAQGASSVSPGSACAGLPVVVGSQG
jgi:hypothetical protein